MATGTPLWNCSGGSFCGAVNIFRYDVNQWVFDEFIGDPAATAHDGFGVAVAINGNRLAVGAPRDKEGDPFIGAVYVFRREVGGWTQEQKIIRSAGPADIAFGDTVSLDGNRLAIGAPIDDCSPPGKYCGSAFVYELVMGTWVERQQITALDAVQGDGFGKALALRGDVLAIGSRGAVYMHRYNSTSWDLESKVAPPSLQVGDRFGTSIATGGDSLVAGAPGVEDVSAPGSAHVFRHGVDGWTWQTELQSLTGDPEANFGTSVGLLGDYVVVGAPFEDGPPELTGAAYVFRLAACAGIPALSNLYLGVLGLALIGGGLAVLRRRLGSRANASTSARP